MLNRINLICLGVRDLDAALNFYKKIGFKTTYKNGSPIVFFNNAGTKLELYPIDKLAADINKENPPKTNQSEFSGITLACNMKSKDEVDQTFELIRKVGGQIVKKPQFANWGGYSGYFKDLDGYYWEVAYSEYWQFDENDMLIIE